MKINVSILPVFALILTAFPLSARADDADGAKLYMDNCVACHKADGKGDAPTFPALLGQPVVAGDPTSLIKILLLGPANVLPADRPKSTGVMPPFARLSDAQIAAILTYIRTTYGNKASAVTEDDVTKVRGPVVQ